VPHEITVDDTVPTSIRPSVQGLVARLMPAYPHVRRVHVSFDESWIVTAWDGMGTAVVDPELIEAIRKALSTAEHE
jgi:mono/diheme cytochrome c family protein